MDTITHALVGTAVSDSWFRKRLGPMATPFALIVSALPDADIFTYFINPENAWTNHRGYTHSFFCIVIAAPILGAIALALTRKSALKSGEHAGKAEWGWWILLALSSLSLHTIFDLITSWGTMPLLPFSNARLSWDVVPILDIFLTSVVAASFVANRILRFEKVDEFLNPLAYPIVHKHPRRTRAADWVARIAIILLAIYLLIGVLQNRQTVRIARQELSAIGVEAVEVRALPIMFTYLAWDIAARDAEGNIYNSIYSSYAPKPMHFDKYTTSHSSLAEQARNTVRGRMFAWYSQNMYVADEDVSAEGVYTITLKDRRFFTLSQQHKPRFIMEFTELAPGGDLTVGSRQMGFADTDIREELQLLWNLTWYGDIRGPAAE